jgi:glutathione S-transferase
MKHYRGWQDPLVESRWAIWMDAIETNEHIRNTTSSDDLYIDSYEPYAQNRPGTTGLADILNGGIIVSLP